MALHHPHVLARSLALIDEGGREGELKGKEMLKGDLNQRIAKEA